MDLNDIFAKADKDIEAVREAVQAAITYIDNKMPPELRCGVRVVEYPDYVDVTVDHLVPYGMVHRSSRLNLRPR